MNNLDKNLQSLKAEFHEKGKAARGLKNLTDNFITRGRKTELSHLLRYHDPIPVEGDELVQRFEVDSLIEFYNLLLIAVFAGYVPAALNEELKEEMILILDNPSVEKYYSKHYPYLMADFTLQYVQHNKHYEQPATVETITVFNEFVSLNRMLKSDTDLERFMGMLDFVWYDGETIAEVNSILSSYEKLNETFTAKERTEAQRGVWGFIKYTAFISQFKELLMATDQYPLLQSAIWMYHGYYFDRIDTKMQDFLDEAFDNLEKAFSAPELFHSLAGELLNDAEAETLNKDELEVFATSTIQQSREDVHFVLNKKWGTALKEYF